jgi:competence protein ComEC
MVSHADADHIDGALTLLIDDRFNVRHVYINPDPVRATEVWDDFKVAVREARRRGTVVHSALTSVDPGTVDLPAVRVEVLAPLPEAAISGPGSALGDLRLSANTNSAVIRLVASGRGWVLLPGDLDFVGLRLLIAEGVEVEASNLVFPHHGGRPEQDDPVEFAEVLCQQVRPERVVFSIGRRGRYRNPRPDIVAAVRRTVPDVHIGCTQLSSHCHPADEDLFTCAGSIVIDLESGEWIQPTYSEHARFIDLNVSAPLCVSGDEEARDVTDL